MNNRQTQLLIKLLETDNPIKVDELSKFLSCSNRTVRNDLDIIETSTNDKLSLVRKPGVGIYLEGETYDKHELLNKLNNKTASINEDTKRRQLKILFDLLLYKKIYTLSELEDKYYESRKVIREDLDAIEDFIIPYKLNLNIQSGVGINITGSEKNKRDLLAKLMRLDIYEKGSKDLINFFPSTMIIKINYVLEKHIPELLDLKEEYDYLNSITIHVLFMVLRIEENASVNLSEDESQFLEYSHKSLEVSKNIVEDLENRFNLVFPEEELKYLALRIMTYRLKSEEVNHQIDNNVQDIVDRLVDKASDLLKLPLNQDEVLKENLYQHLRSSFARIKTGFHIQNPLIQEIKQTYLQIFFIIKTIIEESMSDENYVFPEAEVAYLTVHFQSAIERMTQYNQVYKAILISDYGVGLDTFLKTKIESTLPQVKIIKVIDSSENLELYNYDFVIDVKQESLLENSVAISALFNEDDRHRIINFLASYKAPITRKDFNIFDYTHSFLIYPQKNFNDKEAIVKYMVDRLVEREYVNEEFYESVLSREENSSTYIGSGIAIPHGKTDAIKTSSLSILSLENPVKWQDKEVSIVFLLAIRKEDFAKEETKNLFSLLNDLMKNKEKRHKLLLEEKPLEIMNLLSYFEN